MKKNNTKYMIAGGIGLVLVVVVAVTAATVAGRKVNERKYGVKMESAKQYLLDEDYDTAETLYLQSIEMYPEKTDAYKALISLYIEEGDYDNAYDTADEGYTNTQDTFFETVMERVREERAKRQKNGQQADILQQVYATDKDDDKIAARFMLLDNISAFCYQQYVDTYGSCDVSDAGSQGYKAKFANFSGSVYFKNSDDTPNAVDMASRKITQRVKPYKIVLTSLSMLFVGYDGYLSFEKLQTIFDISVQPKQDKKGNYWISFKKNGCSMKMETDSEGNLVGETPKIIIAPLDLKTVEWVEEPEQEEEEEEDTFVLGGNTYTYDVTEINISGAQIYDLSPLENCKKLRSLILYDCGIEDITPLQGCESLVELCLDYNPFSDLSPLAGLKNLEYLQFHESGVTDLSPIYGLDLKLMNPCSPGVTRDQVEEYKRLHPDCICYWDYYMIE